MKAYNVSGYILGIIDYSCSMAIKPIPSPCCLQVKSFLRYLNNHYFQRRVRNETLSFVFTYDNSSFYYARAVRKHFLISNRLN